MAGSLGGGAGGGGEKFLVDFPRAGKKIRS